MAVQWKEEMGVEAIIDWVSWMREGEESKVENTMLTGLTHSFLSMTNSLILSI